MKESIFAPSSFPQLVLSVYDQMKFSRISLHLMIEIVLHCNIIAIILRNNITLT